MLERKNKLLLSGALLLLFPLCTYLAVIFQQFREGFVLIRFFQRFTTVHERSGPVSHTYWNAVAYIAVIVIAAMLFALDFGKMVNRVLSIIGVCMCSVHLLVLLRSGLYIVSLSNLLNGFGMFCLSIWTHGLLFGLIGYILLIIGFRKFLVKRKLKPWEETEVL